jgi:hypothetical protein
MNENQAIIEAALNNRFAPIIGQIEIKRELRIGWIIIWRRSVFRIF